MAAFFVSRPVFAWVLAIVTMLAGGWAITNLAVSQYPDIAPTTVYISASYSGATAEAVENSVTRVIEDGLTGRDGLLYMESSSSKGSSSISLVFDESIDPVDAQNDVQTKVSQVEGRLPDSVQSRGVSVDRRSTSILLVGALVDTAGSYTTIQLGDILEETVESAVLRTDGVGGINVFGSGYAMRIWLDPIALARYQLTPNDIVTAVEAQNTTVSVGSLGSQPTVEGQQFTATVTAQSQLTSVSEFEDILLKADETGGAVFLGDVATVEIGQSSYGCDSRFNGLPAAGFGISLSTGANAVDTAEGVRETLTSLESALPEGLEFSIAYDTSPFVEQSIEHVYRTLIEAVILVFIVLFVFLQSWRATLIPMIAVPVVLLGTFVVLQAAGYSVNTLTMFAMVLAIGLLVDDAIVVVENVTRLMEEEGLSARDATYKSIDQITSALIGTAVVLTAVFLPMAFFYGSTGVIYRQFSITMVAAMLLSLLVAVILSPALCASILRPKQDDKRIAPARWFNRGFRHFSVVYATTVERIVHWPFTMVIVLAAVLAGSWLIYERLYSSFLPTEDQSVLMTMISLDQTATYQQTVAVVEEVEQYLLNEESAAVDSTFAALGFGFGGGGQNQAMMFVKLRDYSERKSSDLSAASVASRANAAFASNRQARIFVIQPPAITGLGNTGGFSMYLVDQSGRGTDALYDAADDLVDLADDSDLVDSVRSSSIDDEAALRIDIDAQKAESFGLSLSDINRMLSVIFSGSDVNDFILDTSLRSVIVQAEAQYRMQPEDIYSWYARNTGGEMVPFSSFITTAWEPVSPRLARFDGSSAVEIQGSAATGASTGQAMSEMEQLATQLPAGYAVEWTGLSYQEQQSGNQAPYLYAISILIVFLALAALYESWSVPLAVMLVVPVGILGALLAAWALGQSNDVYFKVGILTTIGLAARNAILIVEFAESLHKQGMELTKAAVTAARQRLRPIMMTALTFILGVMPLALASGAGAKAQNAIGIGVVGGTIASTFIGILMVPALYVLVRRLISRRTTQTEAELAPS